MSVESNSTGWRARKKAHRGLWGAPLDYAIGAMLFGVAAGIGVALGRWLIE
jgi:hypothetical protein